MMGMNIKTVAVILICFMHQLHKFLLETLVFVAAASGGRKVLLRSTSGAYENYHDRAKHSEISPDRIRAR